MVFETKDYVVFWGLYSETKFVKIQDIPKDILEMIHPQQCGKYIEAYCGKDIEDIKKTWKVHHWIKDLPDWSEEIPPRQKVHEINYSLAIDTAEENDMTYPYM